MHAAHHPPTEDRDRRLDAHLFARWAGYLATITALPLVALLWMLAVQCAGR